MTTTHAHSEECISYAWNLAEENHRDATGEDVYALPLDSYGQDIRSWMEASAELRTEALYYLDSGLAECREGCPLA